MVAETANPYDGREQTQAKHFILRGYLQELAFKVLRGWDLAYIGGAAGAVRRRNAGLVERGPTS